MSVAALMPATAQVQPPATTIAARTTGFERRDGFIPAYVDAKSGKLLLELPRDSTRALLLVSQATGFGSNPIGIDRGQCRPQCVNRRHWRTVRAALRSVERARQALR